MRSDMKKTLMNDSSRLRQVPDAGTARWLMAMEPWPRSPLAIMLVAGGGAWLFPRLFRESSSRNTKRPGFVNGEAGALPDVALNGPRYGTPDGRTSGG